MSAPDSNLAETKALLLGMVAEADDLKRTAGGSISDAVAGWLAPQYLLAARDKLSATEGAGRFEVLRTFVLDWAVLRHGDYTAGRLHIERERLNLAKRDIKQKWQTKIEAGLASLAQDHDVRRNPAASAALDHLCEALRAESDPQQEREFREWLQRPEIRKEVFRNSHAALNRRLCRRLRTNCTRYEPSSKTTATPFRSSSLSPGV